MQLQQPTLVSLSEIFPQSGTDAIVDDKHAFLMVVSSNSGTCTHYRRLESGRLDDEYVAADVIDHFFRRIANQRSHHKAARHRSHHQDVRAAFFGKCREHFSGIAFPNEAAVVIDSMSGSQKCHVTLEVAHEGRRDQSTPGSARGCHERS